MTLVGDWRLRVGPDPYVVGSLSGQTESHWVSRGILDCVLDDRSSLDGLCYQKIPILPDRVLLLQQEDLGLLA